jgi:iron transport multicopper oxidase
LNIYTVNGVDKYSTIQPISLSGNTVSLQPFLEVAPIEVDFGGIVNGSAAQEAGIDESMVLMNIGLLQLEILGYSWTLDALDEDDITWTNITTDSSNTSTVGPSFTARNLPALYTSLTAGESITVPLNFKPGQVGNYHSIFMVWSSGGNQYSIFTGWVLPRFLNGREETYRSLI